MAGIILYVALIVLDSLLMMYIIKADKHNFKEYCEDMFNINAIQEKRLFDVKCSIMTSIIFHVMFLPLSIVYWAYVIITEK